MKAKTVVIMVVFVAIAGGLFWLLKSGKSPEAQVREKLDRWAENVTKNESETNSTLLIKTASLEKMCAPTCIIETSRFGLAGSYAPEELSALAAKVRGMASKIDFRFADIQVTIAATGDAKVTCTTHFEVTIAGNDSGQETAETEIHLSLIDGTYKFDKFAEVDFLKQ